MFELICILLVWVVLVICTAKLLRFESEQLGLTTKNGDLIFNHLVSLVLFPLLPYLLLKFCIKKYNLFSSYREWLRKPSRKV